MGAPNVIPSGIAPQSSPVNAEIMQQTANLCLTILNSVDFMLQRLHEAEKAAIERLEAYTPCDRLLTLKEAAVYLGYKARTLDGWTSPGKAPLIQFTMLGGEKRFKKQWLDAAIENGSVKPRMAKP